jgi:single stranded DNA-binding protein (ssb)
MLNKTVLMGRLTAQPELKKTQSDVLVTSFTIAVERNFKPQGGERVSDFINCVAWRQAADFISKYFVKGQLIAVVGTLQTRSYDDKAGAKRFVTEVIVDQTYFTGDNRNNEGGGQVGENSYTPPAAESPAYVTPVVGMEDIDLPF